jgi:hypothetical protein
MIKGNFGNSKKAAYLASIPEVGLEAKDDTLTLRCKFNFSYLCKQDGAGQTFGELCEVELVDLLQKVSDFGRQSLLHWQKQKHGGGSTLAIYKNFPANSDFTHPKHVPNNVHWGRFRISGEVRLAGFVVPPELDGKPHEKTGILFDCNTFYVVFIDHNHCFYKSKTGK